MPNRTRLYVPIQTIAPKALPDTKLKPTTPSITIERPADKTWPWCALAETGVEPPIRSRNAIVSRLSMHAPITLPAAISGTSKSTTELTPVKSSGKEVTVASRTMPIHVT